MRRRLGPTEYVIPGAGAAAEVSPPKSTSNDALSCVPKPAVLLDLFHVKHRLEQEACQTHPAFRALQIALGKAYAIPDPRAMEELKQAVGRLNPTLQPREIEQCMFDNYAVVLKHVPRLIPPAGLLLERVDGVHDTFRPIKDITTGESNATLRRFCRKSQVVLFCAILRWHLPLLLSCTLNSPLVFVLWQFSGATMYTRRFEKAVTNLRPHTLGGCISDLPSEFVSVYTCTGHSSKYGIPQYRSARGSSANENYHKALAAIMGGHQTSPQLACSIAVVHNYRRNHRMAGR